MYVHIHSDVQGGQKRLSDPLELDLQAVVRHPMWVLVTLATKPRLSARAASALNYRAISPELPVVCFFVFETGTYFIAQAGLEFVTLLPHSPSVQCLIESSDLSVQSLCCLP